MNGLIWALWAAALASAMLQPAARPVPPTRDPHTPGYVDARELPDGTVPPSDVDGNFIIGPTHNPAPEMASADDVLQGSICNITMNSTDSRIYPGIARDAGTFGTVDPVDPARLVVTTSHPAPYTRRVAGIYAERLQCRHVRSVYRRSRWARSAAVHRRSIV
jgi:hypothetical protein